MEPKFGDGIDWSNEARRAAAEDAARGLDLPIGRSALIDKLSELLPDRGRILDAGSNIGRYCPLIRAAGFEYTGVDQSADALAIARARNPEGTFEQAFLWDMHFAAPFDGAVSLAVLQHNQLAEKERILPRIADAVRPGGIFVMSESTLPEATATQLTYQGWIDLVCRHGFELVETFHPNPEYGLHDAYAFRRIGAQASSQPAYDDLPGDGPTHAVVDVVVNADGEMTFGPSRRASADPENKLGDVPFVREG